MTMEDIPGIITMLAVAAGCIVGLIWEFRYFARKDAAMTPEEREEDEEITKITTEW